MTQQVATMPNTNQAEADRAEIKNLVALVVDQLNAVNERRRCLVRHLDDQDVSFVVDGLVETLKTSHRFAGRRIDLLTIDDFQVAFAVAAKRAARENRALAEE